MYLYFSLQGDIQDKTIDTPQVAKQGAVQRAAGRLRLACWVRPLPNRSTLGASTVDENGNQVTGERADTLIVAHVDPESDHVIMVQFPRL